jgi:hypothetical protein
VLTKANQTIANKHDKNNMAVTIIRSQSDVTPYHVFPRKNVQKEVIFA